MRTPHSLLATTLTLAALTAAALLLTGCGSGQRDRTIEVDHDAWAQAAPAPQGGGISFLLTMVGLVALMYFFMIRPQQKRQKELRQMIDALTAGNEVVTGGGILAKVTDVGEQFLTVEISDGIRVKVQKHSILAVLPKDTIRNV